jgi:hypothetical protein
MMTDDPFGGWVPLFVRGGRGELEWGYMGSERFTEPFCHETLQRLASRPFNQLFRRKSGLDLLLGRVRNHPGLPLKGMIFHMSRCGSTLAAQWLAALPDSVVLSEPEPVGTLLKWLPPDGGEEILRALFAAMGQARRENDRNLFLKAECPHILYIDRLLTAFPGTPWVFIYRDPVEVLVSHQRMPAWLQMLEPVLACGLRPPKALLSDPEGCLSWILSLVLRQARQAILQHGNGLLLNYSEFPHALEIMAGHFGIDTKELDADTLRSVTGRHAKRERQAFQPDSAEKRAAADPRIRELAARWLDEPHQLLEQLRRSV